MPPLLCLIGLHDYSAREDRWVPNIWAPVVTEFHQRIACRRCQKVRSDIHLYQGKDF
jgi:hypothetical protein